MGDRRFGGGFGISPPRPSLDLLIVEVSSPEVLALWKQIVKAVRDERASRYPTGCTEGEAEELASIVMVAALPILADLVEQTGASAHRRLRELIVEAVPAHPKYR